MSYYEPECCGCNHGELPCNCDCHLGDDTSVTDRISARLRTDDLRPFLRTIEMATPEQAKRLGADAADHIDALAATNADLHGLLILSSAENCRVETDLASLQVYASIAAAKIKALVEACEAVEAQSMRTYTAKNGKKCSIEADDGEACEIVHSDAMHHLRAALAAAKVTT